MPVIVLLEAFTFGNKWRFMIDDLFVELLLEAFCFDVYHFGNS